MLNSTIPFLNSGMRPSWMNLPTYSVTLKRRRTEPCHDPHPATLMGRPDRQHVMAACQVKHVATPLGRLFLDRSESTSTEDG